MLMAAAVHAGGHVLAANEPEVDCGARVWTRYLTPLRPAARPWRGTGVPSAATYTLSLKCGL